MKKIGLLGLAVSLLVGCSNAPMQQSPWLMDNTSVGGKPALCPPLTNEHELILSTSEEMMAERRVHAALANLERLPHSIPEARLGKAKILRLLGRSEADDLYHSLLDTCLAADGEHGIGQLLVGVQRYQDALRHLRRAVYLEPTNDYMRNDLGVAYLNLFYLNEAQFEFTTAMELNDRNLRAAENLLTLLLFQQRTQAAQILAQHRSMTAEQFQRAEERAQQLRIRQAQLEAGHQSVPNNFAVEPAAPSATSSETSPSPIGSAPLQPVQQKQKPQKTLIFKVEKITSDGSSDVENQASLTVNAVPELMLQQAEKGQNNEV